MMSHAPAATRPSRLLTAVWAGAIVLVALALYWPARDAGFVGDDFMILHRLRGLSGPSDALRFFRGEFFEYYRPLGFLSHALDWTIAGADPRQFHRTNLILHAINSVLVLLVTRALVLRSRGSSSTPGASRTAPGAGDSVAEGPVSPAAIAGPLAALLFALHASNHEAVVWVSARFDLLATCWSLAAIWWMVAGAPGASWVPALLFAPAVLSKESAVALPIGAAAWAVFCLRSTARDTMVRVTPWLIVLVGYALARQLAGGVPATGGAARATKLMMLVAALVFLIGCANERWVRLRSSLVISARPAGAVVALAFIAVACLALLPGGAAAAVAREKLAVAGFALIYLVAPVTDVGTGAGYLQPVEAVYLRAALAGLPVVALVALALRRRLIDDDRAWFVGALLLGTLLPISALTEGRRYLYLPSAVLSVALGVGLAHLRGRWRGFALGAVAGLLAMSSVRIASKTRDWIWAGEMTAEGARLVDAALSPACNAGHVVFLTSPVGVRGVYTHFYYETFELPRGCMPETFQVVARVLRVDTPVHAQWTGADTIVLTLPNYRGNLIVSEDLRQFDVPLSEVRTRTVHTPLGVLRAEAAGTDQRLTLTLSPAEGRGPRVFFYYSDGRMRRLVGPPG